MIELSLKVLKTKQFFLFSVSVQSSINLGETLFSNNTRANNRTDLNLGEIVFQGRYKSRTGSTRTASPGRIKSDQVGSSRIDSDHLGS